MSKIIIIDFAFPGDHRVKLKGREKRNKYLDLTMEQKKLWNMKVTIIPIVIGALGTVTKALVQGQGEWEIRGRMENIEATTVLRSARILRRDMET